MISVETFKEPTNESLKHTLRHTPAPGNNIKDIGRSPCYFFLRHMTGEMWRGVTKAPSQIWTEDVAVLTSRPPGRPSPRWLIEAVIRRENGAKISKFGRDVNGGRTLQGALQERELHQSQVNFSWAAAPSWGRMKCQIKAFLFWFAHNYSFTAISHRHVWSQLFRF